MAPRENLGPRALPAKRGSTKIVEQVECLELLMWCLIRTRLKTISNVIQTKHVQNCCFTLWVISCLLLLIKLRVNVPFNYSVAIFLVWIHLHPGISHYNVAWYQYLVLVVVFLNLVIWYTMLKPFCYVCNHCFFSAIQLSLTFNFSSSN